jgi:hypothetical protein
VDGYGQWKRLFEFPILGDTLFEVYREVSAEAWHLPFSQVIYVGDGSSDMPVFAGRGKSLQADCAAPVKSWRVMGVRAMWQETLPCERRMACGYGSHLSF